MLKMVGFTTQRLHEWQLQIETWMMQPEYVLKLWHDGALLLHAMWGSLRLDLQYLSLILPAFHFQKKNVLP